jgi:hypothetical protein
VATYIEYELEDGGTILIAADEGGGGLVPAGRGDMIRQAGIKFEEAFASVKSWVSTLSKQLSEMDAEEVEISFGLKTMGELGNFAVGKLGAEANYQVTLKWSNKPAE